MRKKPYFDEKILDYYRDKGDFCLLLHILNMIEGLKGNIDDQMKRMANSKPWNQKAMTRFNISSINLEKLMKIVREKNSDYKKEFKKNKSKAKADKTKDSFTGNENNNAKGVG